MKQNDADFFYYFQQQQKYPPPLGFFNFQEPISVQGPALFPTKRVQIDTIYGLVKNYEEPDESLQ